MCYIQLRCVTLFPLSCYTEPNLLLPANTVMPVGSCSLLSSNCCIVIQPNLFVQLFYSFFKSLVGKEVIVELKNDLR